MINDRVIKCCICGKSIYETQGNNPYPIKDKGECCDECNYAVVIPRRVLKLENNRKHKEIKDKCYIKHGD